ncbi:SAM-dependent methyltransferase [Streptomyces rishiriensis]|uniref:Uncharacterized protein n=1 Tax=Streptomyces rishiriensis TaxID=68264 RepID=A0ABU0NY68_STRRH|nr:SAM-dependent methyltransferase [Streptomyces rishiriensis]MDQ0584105.1 hypothetical protein [Streptomyces rishiriensis]
MPDAGARPAKAATFFTGLDLVVPEIVRVRHWRPDGTAAESPRRRPHREVRSGGPSAPNRASLLTISQITCG